MTIEFADIDGREVAYRLVGSRTGMPVVLTSGGRTSMDAPGLPQLADALAARGYRVLLWDRPNCGRSHVRFEGRSESHMRADVLAGLIRHLDLGPSAIAGGAGGGRDSAVFATQYPELTAHLLLWYLVGGVYGPLYLASVYMLPSLHAVRKGGIPGLLEMREWQERIEMNPGNRALLESLDPDRFVALMLRWLNAFVPKPGQTIPGVDDHELEAITAPTLIIRGGENDIDHPKRTSLEVHSVIRSSTVVDPPWPEDAWERAFAGEYPFFSTWPLAAPLFDDFLSGRPVAPSRLEPIATAWESAGSRFTPPAGFISSPDATPATVW
ncbi:alpha/beta fold hydrolase [Microbacterium ulmi]|uniref:alpha/beta fold hydrolase n=1 Tax=Microbacterium ulmi TaxID=179095 RepID=UPI001ABB44A1|nr:alpha/beta hydrolase [Microbacterium ulmi]NII68980.1 pimeloyl-ACP methyl ester carboxylesterase [Microbacterium ulmi]